MRKVFEDREFCGLVDFDARAFADLEFRRCYFESSYSTSLNVRRRAAIRNVRMIGCEVTKACSLRGTVVEDVLVDRLKTHGLFQVWGCAFKHVTLKGKIGRVMFSPAVIIGPQTAAENAEQQAFDQANAAYYAKVEWALDISGAEFQECDIRGISARLIRRDPETQVVVTREKALEGRWRELDLSGTDWAGWIDLSFQAGERDVVLVAPKRHRRFKEMLRGLNVLRQSGVAEPD